MTLALMSDRWYAMRAEYEHGRYEDGTGVFCERVLLFRSADQGDAFKQAERESDRYSELNPGFRRIGELTGNALLENQNPEHGAEVWCTLFEDKRSGEDFYHARYKSLEIPPDVTEVKVTDLAEIQRRHARRDQGRPLQQAGGDRDGRQRVEQLSLGEGRIGRLQGSAEDGVSAKTSTSNPRGETVPAPVYQLTHDFRSSRVRQPAR